MFFTIAKRLILPSERSKFYTQKRSYVDVKMKWKRDSFYESIESIHRSVELRPVIALKNCIARQPEGCIPISAVSKRGFELGLPAKMRVARFMRQYPSVFEEFTGPQYNLPWFRLTPEAVLLHKEEYEAYEHHKLDIFVRLKKLIMMSEAKMLPLKIIHGLQWYLGLPDEFLQNGEFNLEGSFRVVEIEDGLRGLAVDCEERFLSVMQKIAMKKGMYGGGSMQPISYPLFPSKGLRLKRKISDWLDVFQRLPYVSPYEDYSLLNPCSDVSEKRVVGVLHELLSLFVEYSAERKKLLCLRKYLGLPQKFYKAFDRHPHMFYLSLRNKTCTAILKEPYNDKSAIQSHPLSKVRKKYIKLIKESEFILKSRRINNPSAHSERTNLVLDLD